MKIMFRENATDEFKEITKVQLDNEIKDAEKFSRQFNILTVSLVKIENDTMFFEVKAFEC